MRRSQFVSYMQGLLSVPGVRLCWDTNVRMDSHTWSVTIYNPWVTMSSSPTSFVVVDPPEQQADGSWLVLTMQYGWIRKSANAHDSLKTLQVHMEYDIVVYGRVYLQGKTILITAQTVAQMEFDHTEAWLGKYTVRATPQLISPPAAGASALAGRLRQTPRPVAGRGLRLVPSPPHPYRPDGRRTCPRRTTTTRRCTLLIASASPPPVSSRPSSPRALSTARSLSSLARKGSSH